MKTYFLSLLIILSCCLSGLFDHAYAQGRSAYNQAEILRKENKYREAIRKYNEAIGRESDNYKYYFQRGRCEYALSSYPQAKISFEKTITHKSNFASGYAWLARTAQKQDHIADAISNYEFAASYETDRAVKLQYYLLLINLQLEYGQLDKAKTTLADARQIAPDNENVLYFRGKIAEQEEKWEDAKGYYEQALQSDGLNGASAGAKAKFYYGLGLAKNQLGDKEGAQAAWEKAQFGPYQQLIARQKAQTGPAFNYRVALSYYFNEEYDESERYANKVIEDKRDFSGAYVLKGKIANKQGNTSAAISHYNKAISIEKDPIKKAKAQMDLANLHLQANRPASALTTINQAKNTEARLARNSKLLSIQAKAEYKAGKFEEAVQTLEMLLSGNLDTKQKAKYSFLLGMAAKKSGDVDKAKEAFKDALFGPYKPAAELELKDLE